MDEHQKALRQARSILNKLTPEKFDKLSGALVACVTTEQLLGDVIGEIVAKAQMEHNFSVMYAELTQKLSQVELPGLSADGKTFRRHMLIHVGSSRHAALVAVSLVLCAT